MRRGLTCLALLAILGGCAGGQSITTQLPMERRHAELVQSATGGRQFVEVLGAPADGATPAEVVAALQAPAASRNVTYILAEPGVESLRTVLEFGGASGGDRSCTSPSGVALSGSELRVSATICRGARAFSAATLVAAEIAGPSSPDFTPAMRDLIRETLRFREPPVRPGFGIGIGF